MKSGGGLYAFAFWWLDITVTKGVIRVQQIATKKSAGSECHINPALWDRFSKAETREAYCRAWLALQCVLISKAVQGVIVLGEAESGSYSPVGKWPETGKNPERLADITLRVCEDRCGLLETLDESDEPADPRCHPYAIAYPILIDDRLYGAVAVEVVAASETQLKDVMAHLQWGVSWMELLFRRQQAREDREVRARLKTAVDMMAGVLSEKTCDSACMTFVTEMATQLSCDRVSLSFLDKTHARVQTISHSAQVRKRMNLVRAIGQAMDEAILQRRDIVFPPPSDADVLIVRQHKALADQYGAGSIFTLPVYGEDRHLGALTFERSAEKPFTTEEMSFCRSVAVLLFPVLEAKRREDRLLIFKVKDAIKDQVVDLFGPDHTGRKLLLVLLLSVAIFFSLKTGDYRISADTVLEGAIRRVVVAPFDGYMKETNVKAGDVVAEGAIMCILDDRDLRLDRLTWLSKRSQYQKQYQEAMARHNRAEASIIKTQLDQASAKFDLADSQIERTRITAPFEGIVIQDNLAHRMGGSVAKGEVLFELMPLDAYRIVLAVDERRIADVRVHQRGRMILSAFPTEPIDFVVEKITPITIAREGLNFFRVEAIPDTDPVRLRPGMEGVGKIDVDRRNLFSIWTRGFREWFTLWLWSWWP